MTPSRLSQMTRAVDLAPPDGAAVSATGARHRRVFSADSTDLSEFMESARSLPPPVRGLSDRPGPWCWLHPVSAAHSTGFML